jgi:hypothetical protein
MKYLKEYTEYKSYTKMDGTYSPYIYDDEIDDNDYYEDDGLDYSNIPFTDNEKSDIINLLENGKETHEMLSNCIHINKLKNCLCFDIYKEPDEYYYVLFSHGSPSRTIVTDTYKCDQIHGLIDCINMLKNKYEW